MSIRLFFGSSTPAIRAIAKPFLALALLVARVGAQDAHDALRDAPLCSSYKSFLQTLGPSFQSCASVRSGCSTF